VGEGGITAKPDGNLWFAEVSHNLIGKLTTTGPLCAAAPAGGCRKPAVGQKGSLVLTNDATNSLRDELIWKRLAGSATAKVPDFGTPPTTTDYQLCIYDGTSALIGDALAPAGGTCARKSCWSENPKGLRYADKERTPEGIRQILLNEGAAGEATIIVRGRDQNLTMPPLPSGSQLINSNGVCWEATYSTATTNSLSEFKAKPD